MSVYNTTRFVANEQPLQSRKFANWDKKISDAISLSQLCLRESKGEYGVIQYAQNWNFERFFWYDETGAVYINRTDPVRLVSTYPNVHLEGTPVVGNAPQPFGDLDILYLGFPGHFDGINYILSVLGTGGSATTTYEYWHSILEEWIEFSPTSGVTVNEFFLATEQNITWTMDLVPSWGPIGLTDAIRLSGGNDVVDNKSLYWIRIMMENYTIYPAFYTICTDKTIIDMYVYPSYIDDGAERAIWIAPGEVVINGVVYELTTPIKIDVDTIIASQPYYGAVVIDYQGIMSIETHITNTTAVQVVVSANSIKLADILLNGTGVIETADITDVRLML